MLSIHLLFTVVSEYASDSSYNLQPKVRMTQMCGKGKKYVWTDDVDEEKKAKPLSAIFN